MAGKIYQGFKDSANLMADLAMSQLGLGKLPTELNRAIKPVAGKVEGLLRQAVGTYAAALPGSSAKGGTKGGTKGGLYDGMIARPKEFVHDGEHYRLWAATGKFKAVVKIARKQGDGSYALVKVLETEDFVDGTIDADARINIGAMIAKAQELNTEGGKGARNR